MKNLFTPADSKEVKAFNSSVNLCESVKDISREEREAAFDNIDKLIAATKKQISEQE